jgi:hypothetical protein
VANGPLVANKQIKPFLSQSKTMKRKFDEIVDECAKDKEDNTQPTFALVDAEPKRYFQFTREYTDLIHQSLGELLIPPLIKIVAEYELTELQFAWINNPSRIPMHKKTHHTAILVLFACRTYEHFRLWVGSHITRRWVEDQHEYVQHKQVNEHNRQFALDNFHLLEDISFTREQILAASETI